MTQEEFTILQMAEAIREADRWESYCEGCKFLGDATWHFADRTGKTHYCNHPDRQDGHHDPRPCGFDILPPLKRVGFLDTSV